MFPPCDGCISAICPGHVCAPGCEIFDRIFPELRRYLYRNVACEFRKAFSDFNQMPDLPGWE